MNRKSISSWIINEKSLFSLYFKKNVKTLRAYVSVIIVFVPNFFVLNLMTTQSWYITQRIFEYETFWQWFIRDALNYYPIVSILLTGMIISQDFSKGTAQLIYSSISRKKYLLSNLRFLIIHIFILQFLSFLVFSIQGLIILNIMVSPLIFLIGFTFTFFNSLFFLSFTFILTTLTRSNIISILLPFVYLTISALFVQWDMELLAITYYSTNISEMMLIYIWNGVIIKNINLFLSVIVFLLVPLILLTISIFGFETIEIRHS